MSAVPADNPLGLPIEWLGEGPRFYLTHKFAKGSHRFRFTVRDAARNGLPVQHHDTLAGAKADVQRRNERESRGQA